MREQQRRKERMRLNAYKITEEKILQIEYKTIGEQKIEDNRI